MIKRILFPLLSLGFGGSLAASVSVITKVRCEIDFPFDSVIANARQLEACLQKMKGSTITPDHLAIYASASPPGSPAYNFALSKRRSQAIAEKMRAEFPKAEQEFFPGGVNPAYGQKAVVVASISSSEPIYLRETAEPADRFLRVNRVGLSAGAHQLRDRRIDYRALGAFIHGRTQPIGGLAYEIGFDALSLQAEDSLDQYALSADLGPVFSWRRLDFAPKAVLRHLVNTEGTSALDFGFRVQAGYRFDFWQLALSAGASQESKEAMALLGRSF